MVDIFRKEEQKRLSMKLFTIQEAKTKMREENATLVASYKAFKF